MFTWVSTAARSEQPAVVESVEAPTALTSSQCRREPHTSTAAKGGTSVLRKPILVAIEAVYARCDVVHRTHANIFICFLGLNLIHGPSFFFICDHREEDPKNFA